MNTKLDFKELERKAWKSFYQDGLWDIYLGLILLNILVGEIVAATGASTGMSVGLSVAYMLVLMPIFWLAKRFITVPRLGRVKFGQERKVKKNRLAVVMTIAVLITLALVLFTRAARLDPSRFSDLSSLNAWATLIFGAVVGIPMFFLAYFNDFARGYYIAAVYALSIMGRELIDTPIVFVIGSAMMIIPGLVLLVRFLREYPVRVVEEYNGG